MRTLLHDFRYAWRMLLRWPTLSVVAVLTLALGVGANTVIFSFVDLLWLRPMAVPEPDRVVRVYTSRATPQGEYRVGETSYPDLLDLRQQTTAFSGLVGVERRGALLDTGTELRQVLASVVTDDFFDVMRLEPTIGRVFRRADAEAGVRGVLLSHGFWKRHYHSDRSIVGQTITLTRNEVVVLGVLPADFRASNPLLIFDFWIPLSTWEYMVGDRQRLAQRDRGSFEVYGRLAAGKDLESAGSELEVVAARLARTYPQTNTGRRFTVVPESSTRAGWQRNLGVILLGIGLLIVLMAAANVAGLLLARGEQRHKEFATRLALGSRPARLARQLLLEGVLLAALGAAAAFLVAGYLLDLLPLFLPAMLTDGRSLGTVLDGRALLFSSAILLLSVLVFGLVPALPSTRIGLMHVLRGASDNGGRILPLRSGIIVAQVAIAIITVTCAGLLVRTVIAAQQIDPGFDPDREVVIVSGIPGLVLSDVAQMREYLERARARAAALPGVTNTAYALRVPFDGSGGGRTIKVASLQSRDVTFPVFMTMVTDGYFETLGTSIRRGRGFLPAEIAADRTVAVINETLRRRLWPDSDPLGQRLLVGDSAAEYEVVGVVQDGKYADPVEEQRPYIFLPLVRELDDFVFVASTSTDAGAMVESVRRQFREADPQVPITRTTTLSLHLGTTLQTQRLAARLVSVLGALGLFLAAAGIYGLITSMVTRRRREIGVRVALGAARTHIFRLIIGRALRLTLLGTALGLLAAWIAARMLHNLLYGVSPWDPLTYLVAVLVLTAAAVLAAFVPALRATRLDAMEALRYE